MPYSLVENYRSFGETSCHNLCRDKGKFFNPEAGGSNYFEMLASIYQTMCLTTLKTAIFKQHA